MLRIRGFILNKPSVLFFSCVVKVLVVYIGLHLIQNNVKYPPKSKTNKTRQNKKQLSGRLYMCKELLLLMNVLDLLLRRPKIRCTFLEVQCQLMYSLLTVSRLQRQILPHCSIKVIACDKRTYFLDIIHTCRVEVVRVITKTP